jgi:hypothetical protein
MKYHWNSEVGDNLPTSNSFAKVFWYQEDNLFSYLARFPGSPLLANDFM